MSIPESQLETWSRIGSVTQSKETYSTIKRCLDADGTPFVDQDFQVFLQGSYANDTNIYAESDVDVVIRLDSSYYFDISALTPEESTLFCEATGGGATYGWIEFRRDVLAALREAYGDAVTPGRKAIAIAPGGSRRRADVLVSVAFRRYRSYSVSNPNDYTLGICFFVGGERVVNYPKQHSVNCTRKHQASDSWFKPTVRILKNMRQRMVRDGFLPADTAPSYFLEGLLYNVPDDTFGDSYESTIVEAVNWIQRAERQNFVCANGEFYLLRDVPHVCWSPTDCDRFLSALERFWRNWE